MGGYRPLRSGISESEKGTVEGVATLNTFGTLTADQRPGAYMYTASLSQYSSTPSTASLQITGDMEIVFRIALDDYTPTISQFPISKRSGGDGLQFQIGFNSTVGTISFSARIAGVDRYSTATGQNPGWVDGTTYWFRVRREATTGTVTMDYAADQNSEPTTWTALTVSGTQHAGPIDGNAAALRIAGLEVGPQPCVGKHYRYILRDGIDGTTVADWNAAIPTTYYHDVTGRTWTAAGSPAWGIAE